MERGIRRLTSRTLYFGTRLKVDESSIYFVYYLIASWDDFGQGSYLATDVGCSCHCVRQLFANQTKRMVAVEGLTLRDQKLQFLASVLG